MTSTALKILVTGPATDLRPFFTKLASLQTKHSFTLCLSLALFSTIDNDSIELAELLAGKIDVPLPVYVAVGEGLPEKVMDKVRRGEEVCRNVTVLNKAGVLTLASGLKIATFGGSYDAEAFSSQDLDTDSPHFTSSQLDSFLSLLVPAPSTSALPPRPISPPDILLTHAFPSSLAQLSAKPLGTLASAAPPLDNLAKAVHAKYHFVGGTGMFWEREPFTWERAEGGGTCRALCLGAMGGKERWFYAFSITPNAAPLPAPANSTASPFSVVSAADGTRGTKRSLQTEDVNEYGIPNYIFGGGDHGGKRGRAAGGPGGPPPDHYTCNICEKKGHWIQECPERAERDAARGPRPDIRRPIQPDECWFCLSNPKLTKHLIASIGTEVYVTLPKGQLPSTEGRDAEGEGRVPGGGHVLIIPIAHYPTLLSIPADASQAIVDEIASYKEALKKCYAKYSAKLIAFEVGKLSGKGGHAHVQICPISESLAGEAEKVFVAEGAKQGITFEEVDAATLASKGEDDYFRIDLPDGRVLTHFMAPGTPFNLQFGRATMALVLRTPERTDWKACSQSEKDEKVDTGKFKIAFKEFDPSE